MRINPIKNNVSFCRELRKNEIEEFKKVTKEAKVLAGQTGESIFIVHDACLPREKFMDTGLGNLATKEAKDFFRYMKTYLDFSTVEVLPAGEVASWKGAYCAYAGTALSLGNHQINPMLLTTPEFGNILEKSEYNAIVNANNKSSTQDWRANFKNVMPDNSPQDKALKIAYNRFKMLPEDSPLKQKFVEYKSKNNDWLEPKGVFKALLKKYNTYNYNDWPNEIDKNLYNSDFDNIKRTERLNSLISENFDDIEFFKFKQYIADRHLEIARENLHDLGLTLKGDCEIGFSADEKWANPKAFKQGQYIGMIEWGLPALDYDTITNPDSAAAKLLKRKVQLCASRYDSIRFDVGWAYFRPKLYNSDGSCYVKDMGDSVLNFIENSVKEIKGQDYDLKNLVYEFEGGDIFQENGDLFPPVKNRVKVVGTTYMNPSWGSNDAFLQRGWSPDEFVVGVGNHDPQPLRQIAQNVRDITIDDVNNQLHKWDAIDPLARILKIDSESLRDPVTFAKAKWAEPMMAKNNYMFYMDVFGREERFDMQSLNNRYPDSIYAYKIPENYKELYHKAIREGFGFNIADSLEKVFKAKGLDKSHPELYAQIVHFNNVLNELPSANKGGILHSKSSKFIAGVLSLAFIALGTLFVNKHKSKDNHQDIANASAVNRTQKRFSMEDFGCKAIR